MEPLVSVPIVMEAQQAILSFPQTGNSTPTTYFGSTVSGQIAKADVYSCSDQGGGLLMSTHTTYMDSQAAYAQAGLFGLSQNILVTDGEGNAATSISFNYDEANGSPLVFTVTLHR